MSTPMGTSHAPVAPAPSRRRPRRPWHVGLVLVVGAVAVGVVLTMWLRPSPAPFTTQVVPSGVGDAIPGQSIVLLATLTEDATGRGPADVSAEPLAFADAVAIDVRPARIAVGEVAELTVVIDESVVAGLDDGEPMLGRPVPARTPDERRQPVEPAPGPMGPEGVQVPVRVTITLDGRAQTTDVPINVSPGEDTLLEAAAPLRDRFVAWLATEHPELGLTPDTAWTPTIVQPHILVVSHYLFLSEEWEMGVMWHIMIPPHDWARIYLRPRGELAPTMAFEISSVSDPASPVRPIDVPSQVDR